MLQIALHARLGLRLSVGISLRIARGSRRQSTLPLILGQLCEAVVHLLAQMIVHVLEIVDAHGNLRTTRAISALAADHAHIYVLIPVRRIVNSPDHRAGAEAASGAVALLHAERGVNDKGAMVWIKRVRRPV